MSETNKHNGQPKQPKARLSDFIGFFPELSMPVVLGGDTHMAFSRQNKPLPRHLIERFLEPLQQTESDEFTEFVPCFRIADTEKFSALVYWKAELLNYQYVLLTFTDKGELIGQRVIAGTTVEGDTTTTSVANIDEDLIITIASGQSEDGDLFDGNSARTITLEILANGTIIEE